MKEANVWDFTFFNNNYQVLNNISDVVEKIKSGDLKFHSLDNVREKFVPGDRIQSMLDSKMSEGNIILKYTDKEHPVVVSSSFFPSAIHPDFYNQYKKEINEAIIYYIKNGNKDSITIPEFICSDELIDYLITNKSTKSIYFSFELTPSQISKFDNHFMNVYMRKNGSYEEICSKYVLDFKTLEQLQEDKYVSIFTSDLSKQKISNYQYLPEGCILRISRYTSSGEALTEEEDMRKIKDFLDKISQVVKHQITVKMEVNRRSYFNKIFKDYKDNNIDLVIENDFYDYPLNQYMEEERRLEEMVKPIKEANLSPLEKFLACYNIVKQFKEYKENPNNLDDSRKLHLILDNEYMVCVGFAKLLIELLDLVGINANELSVSVDTSYDKGFTLEEKGITNAGHARVVVSIDDDKYNVHGLYVSDPTWDNDLQNDYLNHALMTFDKMQVSRRLFAYSTYNPILDIHNFNEFNDQVNFLLKRALKEKEKNAIFQRPFGENLIDVYKDVSRRLIDGMMCDDKYPEFNKMLNSCQNESDFINFLTELGNYSLTRINQKVDSSVIIKASMEGYKKMNGLKDEENNALANKVQDDYIERDLLKFPYEMDDTELGLRAKSR